MLNVVALHKGIACSDLLCSREESHSYFATLNQVSSCECLRSSLTARPICHGSMVMNTASISSNPLHVGNYCLFIRCLYVH